MLTLPDVVLRRRFPGAAGVLRLLRLTVTRSLAFPLLSRTLLLPDLRFLTLSAFSYDSVSSVLDFCSFVSYLDCVCSGFPIFAVFVRFFFFRHEFLNLNAGVLNSVFYSAVVSAAEFWRPVATWILG